MYFLDWLYNALASLGLYNKHARIAFLGLDNAGKSTLCYLLKESHLEVFTPTLHPQMTEFSIGHIKIKAYDLGGHETVRKLWEDYSATVDAVVFIVDAVDRSRFPEAAQELHSLLKSDISVPFLVLGNKIDNPYAASEDELRYSLGLQSTYGKDNPYEKSARPVELFMCSLVRRMGYCDGFQWLSQFLS